MVNEGSTKEKSKPNPVNVYGKTKYLVEKHLIESGYDRYHIVRTGANINMSNEYRCMIEDTYLTLLKEDPRMASDNLFTITDVNDFNRSIEKLIRKNILRKYFIYVLVKFYQELNLPIILSSSVN